MPMANADDQNQNSQPITIGPRDVLFECPACRKSLVVDESAEGMIVDCPQCRISIIVPPKNGVAPVKPPAAPPAPASAPPAAAPPVTPAPPAPAAPPSAAREKLTVLAGKLKELQTQRTEVNNRLASRINEVNRDLVLLARLETSHQQILVEFYQVLSEMSAGTDAAAGPATRTRVNFGG
jgi:hypothetical protein